MIVARRFRIEGRVQGVGFRPFLARLAHELALAGEVANVGGRVQGVVEGTFDRVDAFMSRLQAEAPTGAVIHALHEAPEALRGLKSFIIHPAGTITLSPCEGGSEGLAQSLMPDHPPCPNCLAELLDSNDRRHRHPFIACAACGPRVSMMTGLPWDRGNTGMDRFALCPDCRREFHDPSDRRFHAEAIACPACGPRLWFVQDGERVDGDEAALARAVELLRAGGIVALKGVGGYHLMCDARNAGGVARLRERKHRPAKPLAVMYPWAGADGLDAVRQYFTPVSVEAEALVSAARPIVLLGKPPSPLRGEGDEQPEDIAPGLDEIGVMLPASPLHHLLLADFGGPLVATSGNRSGEPLASTPEEAETRLSGIADAFLHHDRPILWPMDDPVRRVIAGVARPLRLGRGDAPLELDLPFALDRARLAVGGQMKNAVALGWGQRAVLSPHVGDLDSPRALSRFAHTLERLQALYGVQSEAVVHDAHPGYASTRRAMEQALPTRAVRHHAAHASALYAEAWMDEGAPPADMLVLAWDGLGLGEDGGLWGGEALLGQPGRWQRVASLRAFRLPGGERAAREPWRCALGLCWEAGVEDALTPGPFDAGLSCPAPFRLAARSSAVPDSACPAGRGGQTTEMNIELLRQAWMRGLNAPFTSSMGRLFDAAAALLGLCSTSSYEGEAAMRLEAAAAADIARFPPSPSRERAGARGGCELPWLQGEGLLQLDWSPLLPMLMDASRPVGERAMGFHASLARASIALAQALGVGRLGLTGGVMQNRLLVELIHAEAERAGVKPVMPARVPVNDAGLAFGQLVEAHFQEHPL